MAMNTRLLWEGEWWYPQFHRGVGFDWECWPSAFHGGVMRFKEEETAKQFLKLLSL
jgi:hypothetical protein